MRIIKTVWLVLLSNILLFTQHSVFAADEQDIKPITVYTSILPQRYFVEKIGGDRVNVKVLVSPGKSPATYEPTPQQVMGLGSAAALFTIGVPFEKAFVPMIKSTLPSLKIVDTTVGIQKRIFGSNERYSHEKDHSHSKGVKDPHIWLSPRLVKVQAKTIFEALVKSDPANRSNYQRGYESLISELEQIDTQLAEALRPYKGMTMFVFHPAFGYFSDDYGLKQVAIETGGKEPTPSDLEKIIEHAKKEKVRIIFVQPEFSQSAARAIAESIDGAVVTLSPLNPDYIANLSHIATEVEKAFR